MSATAFLHPVCTWQMWHYTEYTEALHDIMSHWSVKHVETLYAYIAMYVYRYIEEATFVEIHKWHTLSSPDDYTEIYYTHLIVYFRFRAAELTTHRLCEHGEVNTRKRVWKSIDMLWRRTARENSSRLTGTCTLWFDSQVEHTALCLNNNHLYR